ncbi:heparan-alpha-glucosaminide N-acetyltransferase domain-containing protein [Georgenia sp. SYP-B2076]|uniref:heparan-alpha-glucosaminide N-acetyltransferase domain-containing protein n=1 Tax=Georgenia sp. SYP-B2076 TaxID=2495881 RepID=UPI000F8DFD35|nr:heparan-alpha-glucosaminide N-acetyltransferase domain-containing protein [Georgenia sp. SYP-B2076]
MSSPWSPRPEDPAARSGQAATRHQPAPSWQERAPTRQQPAPTRHQPAPSWQERAPTRQQPAPTRQETAQPRQERAPTRQDITHPRQAPRRAGTAVEERHAGRPRLVGIDIARGLAILGMFVAHLGDDAPDGTHDPAWFVVADGRSAALFALLAGVSLALASGRERLPAGPALAHARLVTLARAGLLLVLGWFLVMLGTPVAVILPAYAVLFVLALPFLGLRRRWLLLGAAAAATVSPTLIALVSTPVGGATRSLLARALGAADPVRIAGDELVTGMYPALVYLAYVLVGLALGRSDLSAVRTEVTLLGGGAVLAVLGWGTSRLALDAAGPDAAPLTVRLVGAAAHDDSTLEVVGNVGTSLAVIGLLLLLTRATATGRAFRPLLSPVAAAGSMSLTVYSVHIVAISLLGDEVVWSPDSNAVLVRFVVVALAGAWVWRRYLGRGPLERALHAGATAVAGPRPA